MVFACSYAFRFGNECCSRLLNWIILNIEKNQQILDVGCGNGRFLKSLFQFGFSNLSGVDFSEASINLACSALPHCINLNCMNVLYDSLPHSMPEFDLIFDKGTFDAISLNPNLSLLEISFKYESFLMDSLKEAGLFMITSCNWTKEELLRIFSKLKFHSEIVHRTFKFGSKQGADVTTLVFIRK